jgi:hypothetical protein
MCSFFVVCAGLNCQVCRFLWFLIAVKKESRFLVARRELFSFEKQDLNLGAAF